LVYARTPTHKECAHFNSGFCILYNIAVDPNQVACPNFTPKGTTSMPKPTQSYQQTWQQDIVGFRGIGRGIGMGRGGGHGIGMGRGRGYVAPQTFPQAPLDAPMVPTPPMSKEQETQMLGSQMAALQQQLERIKKRVQELG
jgi:hypothetical protein